MKKKLLIVILLLCIVAGAWVFMFGKNGETVFDKDTTISGNYTIVHGKSLTLKNNAKLTVLGNFTIDGTLNCANGALHLVVGGTLSANGDIHCTLEETTLTQVPGIALQVVAKHIALGKTLTVEINGGVDMASEPAKLLADEKAIAAMYEETANDTGGNARLGPFLSERPTQNILSIHTPFPESTTFADAHGSRTSAHHIIPTAFAHTVSGSSDSPSVILRGTWHIGDDRMLPSGLAVPPPPRHIKHMLFHVDFSQNGTTLLEDFTLISPRGRKGDDETGQNCIAEGKNGESAMRLRMHTDHIIFNNTTLQLGSGGDGGAATTANDCAPGVATGGNGGDAGNFKITATEDIEIIKLSITPGKGGNGGDAHAFGKDGTPACPGLSGGDAEAKGGDGSVNKKELSALGKINGIKGIRVDRVDGGIGGNAVAKPGRGGDGAGCMCAGGRGGNARASGGHGGEARVTIPMGAAEAHGGDGGNADAEGGDGGAGGQCSMKSKGGDGGTGGNGAAKVGGGGVGTTANGNPGVIQGEGGGNGGSGGNGCTEGKGGNGGIGLPIGNKGSDGSNLCSSGQPDAEPTPPSGENETPLISAILYHGKYLPVDQLIIENKAGCGERYWRAKNGTVKATDASTVSDSIASCGFGKLSETPTMNVPAQTIVIEGGIQ